MAAKKKSKREKAIKDLKASIKSEKAKGLGGKRERAADKLRGLISKDDNISVRNREFMSGTKPPMSKEGLDQRQDRMLKTERLGRKLGDFQLDKQGSIQNVNTKRGKALLASRRKKRGKR